MEKKMDEKRLLSFISFMIRGFRKKDIKGYRGQRRINELNNLEPVEAETLFRLILETYTVIIYELK